MGAGFNQDCLPGVVGSGFGAASEVPGRFDGVGPQETAMVGNMALARLV